MNFFTKQHRKKLVMSCMTVMVLSGSVILSQPIHIDAAKYNPSYGVEYKSSKYNKRDVNILEMDVSDAFTEVQLGKPDPLDKLMTVKKRANTYNRAGNKIVGAVNGNFYETNKKRPVHLIAEDNRLVYSGHISKTSALVRDALAFGIDAEGKGLIRGYNSKVNFTYKNKDYKISHLNKERDTDRMILYTEDFQKPRTDTNDWGTEVILKGPKKTELTLGSTIEVEVAQVRKKGNSKIPKNGFVLSGHGNRAKHLNKMKKGDKVEINVSMDKEWQGSEFMLAGGPQLVKNGKVNQSMNIPAYSMNASTARTVVGVDKTGEKVFFVTVDQPGLNMKQVAKLMKDTGAYTALNLDGGGSTTMVVRPRGGGALNVVNTPSDGAERSVSGILMAADTEPKRIFKDVSHRNAHYAGISWLNDQGITGYPGNKFKYREELSREQSAIMFTETMNLKKQPANTAVNYFSDIPETKTYADYIATVGKEQIFKGKDGEFRPYDKMTRQQMATTIVHALGLEEKSSHKKVNLDNVNESHQKSVQILADYGITNQLDDFRPREAVTRGQFATFLYKAHQVK